MVVNISMTQLDIKFKPKVNGANNIVANEEENTILNKMSRMISMMDILQAQNTCSMFSS
jgi:hypothetical protein